MVGSDKLPTAALGLDVRGAAVVARRRSGAKASAAWAKQVPCGAGSKGRGVELKFKRSFSMGRKKDVICQIGYSMFAKWDSLLGKTKVRTSMVSTLICQASDALKRSSLDCPPKPFLVSAVVVLINYLLYYCSGSMDFLILLIIQSIHQYKRNTTKYKKTLKFTDRDFRGKKCDRFHPEKS